MNFAAQKAIYDSDIAAVEPECGGGLVFYWLKKAYTAQRNEIDAMLLGQDAGYLEQYDFEIIVRQSIFAGIRPPRVEDAIEMANPDASDTAHPRLALRIKSVKPSQDGVSWTWGVKADN